MATTTAGTYTTPDGTSPGDVPYWMLLLAQAVEDKTVGQVTGTRKRMHWQVFGGQMCDASGFVTYTHSAGFTPVGVLLVNLSPATRYPVVWGVDSFTSTTFRARFENAAGTTVPNAIDVGAQFAVMFE